MRIFWDRSYTEHTPSPSPRALVRVIRGGQGTISSIVSGNKIAEGFLSVCDGATEIVAVDRCIHHSKLEYGVSVRNTVPDLWGIVPNRGVEDIIEPKETFSTKGQLNFHK